MGAPTDPFDVFVKKLEKIETITVIMQDTIVDLRSDPTMFPGDNEFTKGHWSNEDTHVEDDFYLPPFFCCQKIFRGFYPFVDKGTNENFTIGDISKPYVQQPKTRNVSHGSFEAAKDQFIQMNYTALVDFIELRDTFDMRIERSVTKNVRDTIKRAGNGARTEDLLTKHPYLLKDFHKGLLHTLFYHYILAMSRILFFLRACNEEENVKGNPSFVERLKTAMACVSVDGTDLVLNSVRPDEESFCNKLKCMNIGTFIKDGKKENIFTNLDTVHYKSGELHYKSGELKIPKLTSVEVNAINDELHITWKTQDGDMSTLINSLIRPTPAVLEKSVVLRDSKIKIHPDFPKVYKQTLSAFSPENRDEKQQFDFDLSSWPIYSFFNNRNDKAFLAWYPKNKNKGSRRILQPLEIALNPSTALNDFVIDIFQQENISDEELYINQARAFLELSCLATGFLKYIDIHHHFLKKPIFYNRPDEYGIDTEFIMNGQTRYSLQSFFQDQIIEGLSECTWLAYLPNVKNYQQLSNPTDIQSFILFTSRALSKTHGGQRPSRAVSTLVELSKSIIIRNSAVADDSDVRNSAVADPVADEGRGAKNNMLQLLKRLSRLDLSARRRSTTQKPPQALDAREGWE